MIRLFLLSMLFVIFSMQALGQRVDSFLTKSQLQLLINRKLSSFVTGNSTGSFISNYASFDPVQGSFSFKGAFPVLADTMQSRISFATFRITGDLISQSFTALFSNSVLNTGVSIEAQYHFRRRKSIAMERHLATSDALRTLQLAYLDAAYTRDYEYAQKMPQRLREELVSLKQQNDYLPYELRARRRGIDSVRNLLNSTVLTDANYPEIKKSADTLTKMEKLVRSAEKDSINRMLRIDSITTVLSDRAFIAIQTNAVADAYQKAQDSLFRQVSVTALSFDWWTITGAYSRKNYYIYTGSAPFSSQVDKRDTSSFRFGIAWNYYKEESFPKRLFYMNLGLQRIQDNNAARLSTTEITDEKVVKNAAGDTTRKIVKKYNAYTDPVIQSNLWQLYANFYFLKSSRASGFHLFPFIDLYDNGAGTANLGVGYLISFRNEKKESPAINTEAYFQLNDVFDQRSEGGRFWNRNEIGIRFTLPFNFFN